MLILASQMVYHSRGYFKLLLGVIWHRDDINITYSGILLLVYVPMLYGYCHLPVARSKRQLRIGPVYLLSCSSLIGYLPSHISIIDSHETYCSSLGTHYHG